MGYKKIAVLIIITVLLIIPFSLISCEKKGEDSVALSWLSTDGTSIVNQEGEIFNIRGVNMGGLFVMEQWMCPTNSPDQVTTIEVLTSRFGKDKCEQLLDAYMDNWCKERDFDRLKALGVNTIRLPISYLTMLNEDYTVRDDAFDRLDWFIEQAAKRDMYVLPDLHAAVGSQNGKDHSGDISANDIGGRMFLEQRFMDANKTLWVAIAQRYKENPNVLGYDILNEPEGNKDAKGNANTDKLEWDYFDELYKAIRAVDSRHIIVMESVWDPTHMPKPEQYGWQNVAYEYHFYNWTFGTNVTYNRDIFLPSKVSMINTARFDVPTIVGEFTGFGVEQCLIDTLTLYNEQGYGWYIWTYKVVATDLSGWGLYCGNVQKADVYEDSFEQILQKWQAVGTENFIENQSVTTIIKEHTAQ